MILAKAIKSKIHLRTVDLFGRHSVKIIILGPSGGLQEAIWDHVGGLGRPSWGHFGHLEEGSCEFFPRLVFCVCLNALFVYVCSFNILFFVFGRTQRGELHKG